MPLKLKSPPAVGQADLDSAAAKLGVTFPAEYAAFLLEHNGGDPQPNVLSGKGDGITIEHFYSVFPRTVAETAGRNLVNVTRHVRQELDLPVSLLPIALVNDVDVLVLTVGGKGSGRVSLWVMIESGYDRDNVHKVADSFGRFIAKLDQPSPHRRASQKQQLEALERAVMDGNLAAIRELVPTVDLSKPVSKDVVHPIHRAVIGGKPSVLKALHASGVDFRARYAGATPLQMAKKRLRDEKQSLGDCRKFGLTQDARRVEKRVQCLEKTVKFLKDLGIK
jgi:SMI1 / KNR4 family (SUKH-1)